MIVLITVALRASPGAGCQLMAVKNEHAVAWHNAGGGPYAPLCARASSHDSTRGDARALQIIFEHSEEHDHA